MTGMLYQVVNKERALLAKQGRTHSADVGKPQRANRPPLRITVKQPEVLTAVPPVAVAADPTEKVAVKPSTGLQTVGLHNVPKELVDALKVEAKRRSGHGKRTSMAEIAMHCLRVGLAELQKAPDSAL